MIYNAQVRTYQSRAVTTGIRQRVSANHTHEMSAELRRSVIIVLCVSLFLVMAGSQLIHWKIMNNQQVVEQKQAVSSVLVAENMNLLAKRAGLMSPGRIEEVAAGRLNLHAPGKDQVHRL